MLLGNELTPELGAILCVYFIQGALGLSRLAVSFFLKDELGLSPGAVASLTAVSMLPWLVKPLYGFLTDAVPLFGFRRRPYLVLSGGVGVAAWLSLALGAHSPTSAAAALIATAASVAISDVVADSLVVERVRKSPDAGLAGALQTLCWGSSAAGGLLAAYASGALLDRVSPRAVFGATAFLPLVSVALAALIAETRVGGTGGTGAIARAAGARARTLFRAVTDRKVLLPVAFVFAWQSAPNADSALFFFQTSVLGFGPEFLGRVRLASSAAALGGLFLYQRFWRSLPVKTLMFRAAVASVPLALTQLILVSRLNVQWGVSDQLFALTDSAVLTALGQVAFMPTLVLAARLCPPGIEGTLFAALMSIYNGSGAVSTELGALLTRWLGVTESDFSNLGPLLAICAFSNLLALPLLDFLDEAPDGSATDEAVEVDAVVEEKEVVPATDALPARRGD